MLITDNKYRAANEKFGLSADFNIEQFLTDLTQAITMIAGGLDDRRLPKLINELMPDALGSMALRPAFRRMAPDERESAIDDWDMLLFILQRLNELFSPLVIHNENELEGLFKALFNPQTLLETK